MDHEISGEAIISVRGLKMRGLSREWEEREGRKWRKVGAAASLLFVSSVND